LKREKRGRYKMFWNCVMIGMVVWVVLLGVLDYLNGE